jgi:hypothetical protein
MQKTFEQVLFEMESAFRRLEAQVPPPVKVPYKNGFVLRYHEKSTQQALLQKFARQISGLHALLLLLKNGFVQEQGVIQRTLDDIAEDILFITLGLSTGNWTEHHTKYLEYFWIEEPAAGSPARGMVKRSRIRAYNNRLPGLDNPSAADANGREIYKTMSGYVHAASVNIIDMCVGTPPRYHLAGMLKSPLYADHVQDAWNYFFRGLASSLVMAKAFEDSELWDEQYKSLKEFEDAFSHRIFPDFVATEISN